MKATKTVIIRSRRRKRTVSARLRGNVIEVQVPAGLSRAEEKHWVDRMTQRLEKTTAPISDEQLEERAIRLSRRYFEGELIPSSVRWSVGNSRWGSCTPDTGTVRVSTRMRPFPKWVLDYILIHELAHLRYYGHGPRFWSLVSRYPLTERARGFLIAKGEESD